MVRGALGGRPDGWQIWKPTRSTYNGAFEEACGGRGGRHGFASAIRSPA